MRNFARRWVPDELTPANKARWVEDARTLLQALRTDLEKPVAHGRTGENN
jgi:hypothetical protein